MTSLHPGVTRDDVAAATGWDVRFDGDLGETAPPTDDELTVLRDLHRRTAEAHGGT